MRAICIITAILACQILDFSLGNQAANHKGKGQQIASTKKEHKTHAQRQASHKKEKINAESTKNDKSKEAVNQATKQVPIQSGNAAYPLASQQQAGGNPANYAYQANQQVNQQCPLCNAANAQSQQAPQQTQQKTPQQTKVASPQEALGLKEIKSKKEPEVIGHINVPINRQSQNYGTPNSLHQNINMSVPKYGNNGAVYPMAMRNAYKGKASYKPGEKEAKIELQAEINKPHRQSSKAGNSTEGPKKARKAKTDVKKNKKHRLAIAVRRSHKTEKKGAMEAVTHATEEASGSSEGSGGQSHAIGAAVRIKRSSSLRIKKMAVKSIFV